MSRQRFTVRVLARVLSPVATISMILLAVSVLPVTGRQRMASAKESTQCKTLYKIRGGSSTWGSRSPPSVQREPHHSSSSFLSNPSTSAVSDAKSALNAFLTRESRNTFIARVYAILAGQLLVTALSITWFGTHPSVRTWMRYNRLGTAIPWLSLILSTVCWCFMTASADLRRQSPVKWQLLALFTIGEAISVGFISSFYKFKSVVSAMSVTAASTAAISFYTAKQSNSKYDLSQWGATLSSCGLIFLLFGVLQLLQITKILPPGFMPISDMVYSFFGACLFSVYLAYHTKLIVAGKHTKYQMSEHDYVFGAMTLYNDIINLFIYVLRLIGEDRD